MSYFYIVLVLKNIQVKISGSSSFEVCHLRTLPLWSQGGKPPVSSPRPVLRLYSDCHLPACNQFFVPMLLS